MTSPLVIITPGLAAGSGGVADHSLALLREWSPLQNFSLLVSTPGAVSGEWSGNVKPLGETSDMILTQLPRAAAECSSSIVPTDLIVLVTRAI